MNRRRKKKYVFKTLLLFFFLLVTIGVGYAYLSTTLNLQGTLIGGYFNGYVNYAAGHDSRLSSTQPTLNKWTNGSNYIYSYSFEVTNESSSPFIGFNMELAVSQKIIDITTWNYDYNFTDYTVTILGGSSSLTPGQKREVTVVITSASNDLNLYTMKFTGIEDGDGDEVDETELEVLFTKNGGWGSNPVTIQFSVTVKNNKTTKISGWSFVVEMPPGVSFDSGWSSTIKEEDGTLIVSSVDWNGSLNPNASTSFGLTFNAPTADFFPNILSRAVR